MPRVNGGSPGKPSSSRNEDSVCPEESTTRGKGSPLRVRAGALASRSAGRADRSFRGPALRWREGIAPCKWDRVDKGCAKRRVGPSSAAAGPTSTNKSLVRGPGEVTIRDRDPFPLSDLADDSSPNARAKGANHGWRRRFGAHDGKAHPHVESLIHLAIRNPSESLEGLEYRRRL